MVITLPGWVQWVIAIGAIATALGSIILLFRKLWPALTLFVRTVNALGDLPQFMSTTAHTLADQDQKIEEIHHEVQFNNGSSVKDAITRMETTVSANTKRLQTMQGNQRRIERGVKGLYTREEIDAKNAAFSDELERTRPPARQPRSKQ
jgi:hypothetical protein